MFTVALIGPDGSGKTTIGMRLRDGLSVPAKYMYMGVNHEASQHLLPTTRFMLSVRNLLGRKSYAGGPRDRKPIQETGSPKNRGKRFIKSVKSSLSLMNRFAEEWYRQFIAWYYLRRRCVVIFDRHFFPDYYAYDIAADTQRTFNQRVHGFMLNHFYPRPDLLLFLDAPSEVLFERKGEGTIELLDQRRADYLQMKELVEHFEVIDANRDLELVVRDVSERITRFYEEKKLG